MTSFAIGLGRAAGYSGARPGGRALRRSGNNLFKLAPDAGPVTVISRTGEDILDRSASTQTAVKVLISSVNASITQVPGGAPALQFPAGVTSPTVPKGGLSSSPRRLPTTVDWSTTRLPRPPLTPVSVSWLPSGRQSDPPTACSAGRRATRGRTRSTSWRPRRTGHRDDDVVITAAADSRPQRTRRSSVRHTPERPSPARCPARLRFVWSITGTIRRSRPSPAGVRSTGVSALRHLDCHQPAGRVGKRRGTVTESPQS